MYTPQNPRAPVSLEGLGQKLDCETKRLVREKEGGIVKYVGRKAVLNGNSTLIFKNKDGAKITLSYRLNSDGNLRLAYEKRFMNTPTQNQSHPHSNQIGRMSRNIGAQ